MLSDEKWTDWKIYGPLGVLTALLLGFLYREVWWLLKKRVENADKQAEDFQKRLEAQSQEFAQKQAQQTREFTDALKNQQETFLKALGEGKSNRKARLKTQPTRNRK
jgi:hypothetical protein